MSRQARPGRQGSPPTDRHRPSARELAAARDGKVADLIAPDLKVLFCGINPGLYSAAVGHHFARPGNRFWPTLHAAGFTPRLLTPAEERDLLPLGYGITNIVDRASAAADELSAEELVAGAGRLEKKVRRYRPRFVAFVGVTAYRIAFGRKHAVLGQQVEKIGLSALWVLPNPSGLNAHYSLNDFARLFAELRRAANE
ncbi:MAG TPA: G/U mismatch-specific DNA glycosylase [Gemmataceae bacterium]|nr:G/U mismatch-specific DNA glycosylase [Gemmataceae bacterium]